MQWKWKAWLQMPHATVHSSDVLAWLAWHSMPATHVRGGQGRTEGYSRRTRERKIANDYGMITQNDFKVIERSIDSEG